MKLIIDGDNLLSKLNYEKQWVENYLKYTFADMENILKDADDDYEVLFKKLETKLSEARRYIEELDALDKSIGIARSCSMNNACEFCTHNTGYDEFGMCLCTEYVETHPKNRCEKYEAKK